MQGIQAYSSYSGLVRALLNQYKVGEERILSKVFAPLYASMLASIGKPLLLPVPASKKGFSDRGFDQMLLIASQLKKSEGYPSLRLFSQKGAGQSKFLSLAEREERHTLSLNPSCKNLLKYSQGGYDFVLLDDIFTTGSTLATCKKLLSDQYGIEAYSMVIAMV